MSDISQELLKRGFILLVILGAIMLIIAVAGEIVIGTSVLRMPNLLGQIIIGFIGFGLIGLGVYFEIKQNSNSSEENNEVRTIKAKPFFISNFPKKLETDFESAQEIWISGISLRQFIQYATIEQKLKKGHKVKILLIQPNSVALNMAESCVYGRIDLEQRRANSLSVLRDLCDLQKIHTKNIEIRTIEILLSFRIIAINPLSDSGTLYVHYYPFRSESNQTPKFILNPKDGHWYNFFKQELLNLWESSTDWSCLDALSKE